MLSDDIIAYISNFLESKTVKLLNKNICFLTKLEENNVFWKLKYNNFLIKRNQHFLILNDTQKNWKYEYLRLLKSYDSFLKYLYQEQEFMQLFDRKSFIIPREIGNALKLETLVIDNCNVKEIPLELFNLINLKILSLARNKIKYIPKEISKLINLRILFLEKNKIKEIPIELGYLIKLKKGEFDFNKIEKIPKEISNLINLEYLSLNNNNLTYIPEEIRKLPSLKELNVLNNKINNNF
ncbi:leucine-rich repeat protein [Catovirus CTV1]|uniref:Leucine-rich repeat protein n=1 Tax=Catovirus CTV1 TaxID=1977631 RepID=A0A1V0SBU5_9VIRU|nr:leucine-rich repeat protein [Catovirus CTV1]